MPRKERRETPVVFEDWSTVHERQRPYSPLQALMEARPLADETDSILALQPLREAVADCLDALAPIDRYLLEACHTERVTYRDMAIRIGYTKSHAYRLTRRAEIHLRDECLQHPVVLAYLGVEASIVPHVDASIVSTVVEVSCERTG